MPEFGERRNRWGAKQEKVPNHTLNTVKAEGPIERVEMIKQIKDALGPVNDHVFEQMALPARCYKKGTGVLMLGYYKNDVNPATGEITNPLRLYQALPETGWTLLLYSPSFRKYAVLIDPERKIVVHETIEGSIFAGQSIDWSRFSSAVVKAMSFVNCASATELKDLKYVRVGPSNSALVETSCGLSRIREWSDESGPAWIEKLPAAFYSRRIGKIIAESVYCRMLPPTIHDIDLDLVKFEIERIDSLESTRRSMEELLLAHKESLIDLLRFKRKELNAESLEELKKGFAEERDYLKENNKLIAARTESTRSKELAKFIIAALQRPCAEIIEKVVPAELSSI